MLTDYANMIFLLLGGNIGNRVEALFTAKKEIQEVVGPIHKISSLYETSPWGVTDQGDFLNQVIVCKTTLSPMEALYACQGIEAKLGRERLQKWGERIIDIDILYYEDRVIDKDQLVIPHPEIQNRNFALVPMVEVAHDFIHPTLKKDQHFLLLECKDELEVKKYKTRKLSPIL